MKTLAGPYYVRVVNQKHEYRTVQVTPANAGSILDNMPISWPSAHGELVTRCWQQIGNRRRMIYGADIFDMLRKVRDGSSVQSL